MRRHSTAIPIRSRPRCASRLAELYGVAPERVLIGRGSDEAIDLLVRAFCREGRDAIVISPPTFGMYAVARAYPGRGRDRSAAGGRLRRRPRRVARGGDRKHETRVPLHAEQSDRQSRAADCDRASGRRAARPRAARRRRGLCSNSPTARPARSSCSNGTKYRGAADAVEGLRTRGCARWRAASPMRAVVSLLRRIQAPYPLPAPSVSAALTALSSVAVAESGVRIDILRSERERLTDALSAAQASLRSIRPRRISSACASSMRRERISRLLEYGVIVRDVQPLSAASKAACASRSARRTRTRSCSRRSACARPRHECLRRPPAMTRT